MDKINNHLDLAYSKLIELYKNSPSFKSLLKSLILPIQNIEDETYNVYLLRWVETAQGEQLDLLGESLGEYRLGKNDLEYRVAILTRISINVGAGEPELIINIIRQLYSTSNITYSELYPAQFSVTFQSDTIIPGIKNFMRSVRPAGVGDGTFIQYQGIPFVFGALLGEQGDFTVATGDFDSIEYDTLELETEGGTYGLTTNAESIRSCEGGQGFAALFINRPTMSVSVADGIDDFVLNDGSSLQFQLNDAHEDYTISDYGGRLATVL